MVLNKKVKSILSIVGAILILVLGYIGIPMLTLVALPLIIPLIIIAIPVVCIIVSVSVFVATAIKSHKENDSYAKSFLWRKKLTTLGISAVFAILFVFGCGEIYGHGIITNVSLAIAAVTSLSFVLAYAFYRLLRIMWRRCPYCGAWMRRINELNDNFYLSPSQNAEERLGSVDYDVWFCRKCGNRDIYPFEGKMKDKYQACHRCGTVAAEVQATIVHIKPEPNEPGKGVNQRHCQYCGYDYDEEVEIPYTT